jgi:hypothetical protein
MTEETEEAKPVRATETKRGEKRKPPEKKYLAGVD